MEINLNILQAGQYDGERTCYVGMINTGENGGPEIPTATPANMFPIIRKNYGEDVIVRVRSEGLSARLEDTHWHGGRKPVDESLLRNLVEQQKSEGYNVELAE